MGVPASTPNQSSCFGQSFETQSVWRCLKGRNQTRDPRTANSTFCFLPPLPRIVGAFDVPLYQRFNRQRSGGEGWGEGVRGPNAHEHGSSQDMYAAAVLVCRVRRDICSQTPSPQPSSPNCSRHRPRTIERLWREQFGGEGAKPSFWGNSFFTHAAQTLIVCIRFCHLRVGCAQIGAATNETLRPLRLIENSQMAKKQLAKTRRVLMLTIELTHL